jgi:Na+-translocating ferredoxin:NAD+ oxidoreductase RNF subunit RnfB
MTQEPIYQELRAHLNTLPGGFRATKNDADVRLLQYLFTPEEARLATKLTLKQETAKQIADRLNQQHESIEKQLNTMAQKGLIISIGKEGQIVYQAAPWMVGIWEFQVNRYTDELLQLFNEYYKSRLPAEETTSKPMLELRTIPINQSIDSTLTILPYEEVMELVDANDKFGVAQCVCRTHAKKDGRGCDAPMETCLMFGDFADFYIRTGRGRSITKTEIMEILDEANKANLVLNPTNSKVVSAICCCCGDCCLFLNGVKSYSKPAEVVASSFIVDYDSEACIGCNVCIDRCQMDAITANEPIVSVNKDKCIGCGLCVSTCPTKSLTLIRKPEQDLHQISETFQDHWYKKQQNM